MATPDELLTAVDEVISEGVRRGLLHNHVEDEVLDGRHVTVAGRRLVNFGSCSYLGLETDPRLKAAVRDAVDRFGTQFSSSRAYASAPLYRVAEAELAALFGRPVIVTPSTSMGHIAAMPTLIGSRDVLILDHQAHHSVHTAARLVQARGARVELIPHNDLRTLERRLVGYRGTYRRVWYAADGLYSMYADFLPPPNWTPSPRGTTTSGSTSTTPTRSPGPVRPAAATPSSTSPPRRSPGPSWRAR